MGSVAGTRKIPWHLILIFSLLSMGILGLGYYYYDYQRAYLKQEKLNELAAIADLKTKQIVDWRKERFADAHMIMEDHFFAAWVRDWLEGEDKLGLKNDIFNRLESLLVYQYQNIALLDPQGRVRLSVLEEEQSLDPYLKTLALEAIQTRKMVFSDLYRSEGSQAVRLSILVPILFSQGNEEVSVGAVLIRVDPHQFLYPLIQSWPTPSRSAEIVLIRREGDEVVVLNELRNRKGTALTLRYSIQEAKLPAAMAARGKEGTVEGVDYRGVPVLAVVGNIPESPWHFVAKIDAAEIYAPLRERFNIVSLLLIVLITGAGVSLASVWSHQQARFYRRQYEMDRERERALRKLNEELEQRVRERTQELVQEVKEREIVQLKLTRSLEDLERSNKELEEFAYVASHDLQEPLRKMASFSDLLGKRYRHQMDERADQYLGYIADGAARLQRLINDLLSFSRVGRADFTFIPTNLEEVLQGTLSDIQPLIDETHTEIHYDPLPTLKVNPFHLRQLFQNLISNSIKFRRDQPPRIHISARQESDEWVIFVRDNGIGFASQYAEQIFEVFKRLHTREAYQGTGIGLAICKKIVERHGGRIWAESEPGQGSTVYFTIPV